MDKLTQSQRDNLTKMSTDRLRGKLAKAGFEESQISTMSREQLLDACATVVLKEQEVATAGVPTVSYDVELEKRRLEFEMRKFEAEEARRKEEREWKEKEWALQEQRFIMEAAEKEREEIRRRENQELEERKRKEDRERELAETERQRKKEEREAEERIALYKLQELSGSGSGKSRMMYASVKGNKLNSLVVY